MGMESAMSPDDQTTIVCLPISQRQSSVNATVVELRRSPPGSTLPSRTVSILLGEFLLVNDTQTDEILPKRAKAMQPAERLRLGPHSVGGGDHVVVADVGRPPPRPAAPRSCVTCGRDTAADNPLVSPVASASIRGSTHPACCATSSAADFDPQILRPIADSPHLSGALPP